MASKQNMYEALRATAAHIAAHPANYSFQVTSIPPDEGGLGCMLGRLVQICNAGKYVDHADRAAPVLLGVRPPTFFHRIAWIMHYELSTCPDNNDPVRVVAALNLYAEKYRAELEPRFAPVSHEGIPPQVRDIFEVSFPWIFGAPGVAGGGGVGGMVHYDIATDTFTPLKVKIVEERAELVPS